MAGRCSDVRAVAASEFRSSGPPVAPAFFCVRTILSRGWYGYRGAGHGGLTVADRRSNERDLLKHYLDALQRLGVESAPMFDEAWLAYRQQVMHGYMWVATPPSMQPDDIVGANVERFSAALEDLETLSALGV